MDEMMSEICFNIILGGGNKWNKISHKLITVKDGMGHGGSFYYNCLFNIWLKFSIFKSQNKKAKVKRDKGGKCQWVDEAQKERARDFTCYSSQLQLLLRFNILFFIEKKFQPSSTTHSVFHIL